MPVINKMPEAMPVPYDFRICVPYLAKRKSDNETVTAIKVGDNFLIVEDMNTAQVSESLFSRYYEVIRVFVKGEDTVTISAW
jgi:hypothetical protein